MELDDLKQTWQRMERELQAQKRITAELLAERKGSKLEASLKPLFFWQLVQLIVGICLTVLAGRYWSANVEQTSMLIVGIIVHIYALLLIINGARVLLRIKEIDVGAPVTALQKQVAQLERTYVLSGWILGLPWWLLWIPVSLMLLSLVGIDISGVPMQSWLPANIVVGIIGMVLTVVGFRWAQRTDRPGVRARAERMASGVSIDKAKQLLADLQRFESSAD